jgi:hypothetical protein
MGWGLCTIREFAHFSVGDHVVIVIPADHKNETKYSIFQRSQFRHRFVNAVGTLVHEGTTSYRASDSSHRKDAKNHASTHHGIERNQKVHLEIRCSIERYPNRDNYLQDVIPLNELTRQIKQRGGIYLAMLDYSPVVTANKSNVLQLLWTEVPFIQVWTNFRRGDHRPPFLIQHDRGTPEYCREIAFHYNNYKDDNQRLRELLLGLERKKNEALTKSHTAFERQASAKLSATESMVRSFNSAQLKGEMEDDRLPQFAEDADRAYSNALLHHYKNFTTNTPLLGDEILTAIYNRIKSLFPMHFTCLHSMLYGKRSLKPARVTSPNNLRKQFTDFHMAFLIFLFAGDDITETREVQKMGPRVKISVCSNKINCCFDTRPQKFW